MNKWLKWFKRALTRRNIIILIVLVLVGVGIWRWQAGKAASTKPQTTYTVTKGDITEVVLASGKVTATKVVTLNFPAAGKLAYVNVKPGDEVTQYQALAGMDTSQLDIVVRDNYYRYLAAEANAKLIEDEVKGHATDENFSQKAARISAQTTRDIAYDNWLVAQKDLQDANLWAPFAGVVTQSTVSAAGDRITPADVITVVDPASMYFEAEVDETDIAKIKTGQVVELTWDALHAKTLGKITQVGFVSRTSDSGGNVYPIRIQLPATLLPQIKIGFNGDVRITIAQAKNTLVLPLEAVADNQVTKADGSKVKVETGLVGETEVEIKSGLHERDTVVPSF